MNISKLIKFSTCALFILLLLYPSTSKAQATILSPENIVKQIKTQNKNFIIKKRTNRIVRKQSSTQWNLYQYLLLPLHRSLVKNQATKLNNGKIQNSCVYFACSSLRQIGIKIPRKICNIGNFKSKHNSSLSLIKQLRSMKWKVGMSTALLLPGDICFTTPDSSGFPTHVYIFMGWVKSSKNDYAYICDNQAMDYGHYLHIRNIKHALPGKEAFYRFMYLLR